jgi:hypothetical protein
VAFDVRGADLAAGDQLWDRLEPIFSVVARLPSRPSGVASSSRRAAAAAVAAVVAVNHEISRRSIGWPFIDLVEYDFDLDAALRQIGSLSLHGEKRSPERRLQPLVRASRDLQIGRG